MFLRFWCECVLNINFAKRFAQVSICAADASFPSLKVLLCSRQYPAIEIEIFVDESLRQQIGRSTHQMPSQICLPIRNRHAAEHCIDGFKKLWLGDVDIVHV